MKRSKRIVLVLLITVMTVGLVLMAQATDNFDVEAWKEDKESVQTVQSFLNDLGYDCGVADGIWGQRSHEALKQYQLDRNLPATGDMSSQTLDQMMEDTQNVIDQIYESSTEISPSDFLERYNNAISIINADYIGELGVSELKPISMSDINFGYLMPNDNTIYSLKTNENTDGITEIYMQSLNESNNSSLTSLEFGAGIYAFDQTLASVDAAASKLVELTKSTNNGSQKNNIKYKLDRSNVDTSLELVFVQNDAEGNSTINRNAESIINEAGNSLFWANWDYYGPAVSEDGNDKAYGYKVVKRSTDHSYIVIINEAANGNPNDTRIVIMPDSESFLESDKDIIDFLISGLIYGIQSQDENDILGFVMDTLKNWSSDTINGISLECNKSLISIKF